MKSKPRDSHSGEFLDHRQGDPVIGAAKEIAVHHNFHAHGKLLSKSFQMKLKLGDLPTLVTASWPSVLLIAIN